MPRRRRDRAAALARAVETIKQPAPDVSLVAHGWRPAPPGETRRAFERFISGPPFERSVERFPNDPTRYGAPGAYRDLAVDLAWEAWMASKAATIEGILAAASEREP